jgi:hypothetical protein
VTIGSLQLGLSSQSVKFQAIVWQQVEAQMAWLTTETKQLIAKMAELRWMYVELSSNIDGTCGPPHRTPGPGKDPPLPPPPLASIL